MKYYLLEITSKPAMGSKTAPRRLTGLGTSKDASLRAPSSAINDPLDLLYVPNHRILPRTVSSVRVDRPHPPFRGLCLNVSKVVMSLGLENQVDPRTGRESDDEIRNIIVGLSILARSWLPTARQRVCFTTIDTKLSLLDSHGWCHPKLPP